MAQDPETTRATIRKRRPITHPSSPSEVKDTKGDADRNRATSYAHTKKYKSQIRKTYDEQPTHQRSDIAHNSTGVVHSAIDPIHQGRVERNRELEKSQATKDTKGNADYFRGRPNDSSHRSMTELVNIARQYLRNYAETPAQGVQGDTKGDNERLAADAFKLTPQYTNDIEAAAKAGQEYKNDKARESKSIQDSGTLSAGVPVGDISNAVYKELSSMPIAQAVTKKGTIVGDTFGPTLAKTVANAGKELVDIPANTLPALYYAAQPAAAGALTGKLGKAEQGLLESGRRLTQPYVDLATDVGQAVGGHPKALVDTLENHPLSTALMASGAVRGLDRAAGKAADLRGVPELPDSTVPGTELAKVNLANKGLIGRKLQKAPSPIMKDRDIRNRVNASFDHSTNEVRRAVTVAEREHIQHAGKLTKQVRIEAANAGRLAGAEVRKSQDLKMIDEVAVRSVGTSGRITKGSPPVTFKDEQRAIDFADKKSAQSGTNLTTFKDPHGSDYYVVPTAADVQMRRFGIGAIDPPKVNVNGKMVDVATHPWAKGAQAVVGTFRKTVLALPGVKWMTGNYVENIGVRIPINKIGPRSFYTGIKAKRYAMKTWDAHQWDEFNDKVLGVGHYQSAQLIPHTAAEEFTGSALQNIAKGVEALKYSGKTGAPRLHYALWNTWTKFTFNVLNGKMENVVRTGAMGAALRKSPLMNGHLVKLHDQVIREAMDGAVDPKRMEELGSEVTRMLGKYNAYDPGMKAAIANYTPFIAWTLNAVKFVLSDMPRNHPVAQGLIAAAYQSSEEWRKDKGLAVFMKGAVPGWLQGSVPTKGGKLRVSRYTPFGVMGDPLGTLSSSLLPMISSVQNNLDGKDWKGDDLPASIKDDPYMRLLVAGISGIGSTIPGAESAYQLSGAEDALMGKDPETFKDRLNNELNPVKPVANKKTKGGSGPFAPAAGGGSDSGDSPFAPSTKKESKASNPFAPSK